MYSNGHGVYQDYKKAFEWYEKAAIQGYPDAQSNQGLLYLKGQGTQENIITGCAWVYISNTNNNAIRYCDDNLNQLQMILTLDLVKELKKTIKEYKD